MDAAEDGARGFPGELLIDDRPNECVEVSPFSPRLETARTDAVDDAGEHRIDALEMTNGRRVHAERMRGPARWRYVFHSPGAREYRGLCYDSWRATFLRSAKKSFSACARASASGA